MYGYIYETTNLINGKKYIGQHKGEFDQSYLGSGNIIRRAILKYGIDNFKVVILDTAVGWKELDDKEKFYIGKLKKSGNEFYNIANGGQGYNNLLDEDGHLLKSVKVNISKATRGIPKSDDMKKRLSSTTKGVSKIWLKNKPWTDEHKKNMSESCKRKYQIQNIIKNDGTPNKGKKMINKNGIIKYVSESEIDKYINVGWNKGCPYIKDNKGRFAKAN
jgi:group I intron endonuclease